MQMNKALLRGMKVAMGKCFAFHMMANAVYQYSNFHRKIIVLGTCE